MTDQTTPGPGDNRPPSDFEIIRERLADRFAWLRERREELAAAAEELDAEIVDGETAQIVTDQGVQIRDTITEWERYRTDEKRPYLEGGRAVDSFFGDETQPLKDALPKLRNRLETWQRKLERQEQARREAEATRLRVEAARLEALARRAEQDMADEESLYGAIAAADEAEHLAAAAADAAQSVGAPVDVQVRGEYGGIASSRKQWVCLSYNRSQLDLDALRPYLDSAALDKAIRAFIKAGGRQLKGAMIEHATTVSFRK